MLPLKSRLSGFTLIEMMVGVVILGLLMSIAVPSFQAYLLNSQILTAAESIQNGLQRARGEAVSRNVSVVFVIGGADTSWRVSVDGAAPGDDIETRSGSEGSKTVTSVIAPPGATKVTFNNFGLVVTNTDGSASITAIALDSSRLTPAESRDLMVVVGLGGSARVCDPNAVYPSVRAC